jgi:hypothetical protein
MPEVELRWACLHVCRASVWSSLIDQAAEWPTCALDQHAYLARPLAGDSARPWSSASDSGMRRMMLHCCIVLANETIDELAS